MKEKNYDWMLSGCHPVSEVAQAYLQSDYNSSAARALRRRIKDFPKLHAELLEAEYTESSPILTPIQIAILIRHWGEPGIARKELTKKEEGEKQKQDIF